MERKYQYHSVKDIFQTCVTIVSFPTEKFELRNVEKTFPPTTFDVTPRESCWLGGEKTGKVVDTIELKFLSSVRGQTCKLSSESER